MKRLEAKLEMLKGRLQELYREQASEDRFSGMVGSFGAFGGYDYCMSERCRETESQFARERREEEIARVRAEIKECESEIDQKKLEEAMQRQ